MPRASAGRSLARASSADALADASLETRARHHLVDQPPLDRARAPDALGGGREEVGVVAPYPALVDQAGEAAGAGQHAEQGHLRQRHGGRAVVDQHDLVAGECQLVAATRGGAVQRAERADARLPRQLLQMEPRLVGELAEVHLEGVRALAEHEDVGAGREQPVAGRGDDERADPRVREAQALDGVGELEVDPEVVGVELQGVTRDEAAVLRDLQRQGRDVVPHLETPVPIARRVGVAADRRHEPLLENRVEAVKRYVA